MNRLDNLESSISANLSGDSSAGGRTSRTSDVTKGISWLRIKGGPDKAEPLIQELISASEETDSFPQRAINKVKTTAGRHAGGDAILYYTPRHTRKVAEFLRSLCTDYEVEIMVEDGALAALLREHRGEPFEKVRAIELN